MNKLHEILSPIQRRETARRLQTTLKRRGNIARGKGVSPGTLRSAEVRRTTALKRLGPTSRATTMQGHLTHKPGQGATRRALQQRIAAGTEMNWKNKLVEALIEMSDEDLEHYKGRPSRKQVQKKKAPRKRLRSKKTQAAYDRAEARAREEAQAETKTFRRGGRGR